MNMKKSYAGVFALLVIGGGCYASFPPFVVVVCPGEYCLGDVSARPVDLGAVELTELHKRIKEIYDNLYHDGEPKLSENDLENIASSYCNLVKLERCGNMLRFSFDYKAYYDLFKFDRDLLTKAFKDGCLPFLFDYTWELAFQAPKGSDRLVHEVAFSQFFGGNIVPKATETDKFQHIQPEYSAGQMFIEQQVNR